MFGISTTVLLIGLWGRAVTVDENTVAKSASEIIDAEIAQDRIVSWVEDAMTQTGAVGPAEARSIVADVRSTPQMQMAIDNSIAVFVHALFAPEGTTPIVDLETALAPVVPVIVDELEHAAVPIDEAVVEAALESSSIALDTGEASGFVAVVTEARALVSQAVVAALLMMLIAGSVAIVLSEERFAMVRTLAVRVLLSALSFAVIFRVGGWALDPERGRSPVTSATSVLLGSNGHVFVITAAIAAVVALVGGTIAWNRRMAVAAYRAQSTDDDTRELVAV